jgi:hypothetical protein
MLRMVKKLFNEVVDLKKNFGEGTSKQRTFRIFQRRINIPQNSLENSNLNLNMEEVGMDNF